LPADIETGRRNNSYRPARADGSQKNIGNKKEEKVLDRNRQS
jgi:hypothetical protein